MYATDRAPRLAPGAAGADLLRPWPGTPRPPSPSPAGTGAADRAATGDLGKCFLHLSYGEQGRRLLRRLDRPDKHWKFAPGDIDDRALWPAHREAYVTAMQHCSAPHAPWNLIPADRRGYRDWAVGRLLLEHLEALDPRHPGG